MTTNTFDTIVESQWALEAKIAYEQSVSKFRGTMREVNARAKTYNFQLLTNQPYQSGKARNAPVVYAAQNWSLPSATSAPYLQTYMIDELDECLTNMDYRNTMTKAVVASINQAYDDVVINALMNYANAPISGSALTLPTANTANYDGMAAVREQLSKNNVDEADVTVALAPGGFNQLITDTNFVNNFNFRNEAVATGRITGNQVVGMNVIKSTRLQTTPSASTIRCFAYHKEAVGVLISKDFTVSVDWVPNYLGFQFSGRIEVGAVIIDPLGVVMFDVTA